MAEEEWTEPGQGTGSRLDPRDILGHLLIIWVIDYIEHSPTRFTQANKFSDVIVVDVVDLDLPDERGFQGLLARKVWWRQSRLIASLKQNIGKRQLCQMTKGTASSGFNAPFELLSMLGDETCRSRAEAWLRGHPDFVPSKIGAAEVNSALKGIEHQLANTPQSLSPAPEKSYLEQLAEQAERGAARTGAAPMPPPVPPPVSPPNTPRF